MDWYQVAGIMAGAFAVLSMIPYLRSIFYGTTRPSIISQSLWFLFVALALAGQYAADGISWSMATGIVTALNNLIIVSACLFGYGYARHAAIDWASGGIALMGVVLWHVTHIPEIAVVFGIGASIAAGFPTYRKTFYFPETENTLAWLLILISALFSLAAAAQFTFTTLALPIFFLVEAGLVVYLSTRKPQATVGV